MKSFFILFLAISPIFSPVVEPYQVSTTLSKDQVWVKLTQFFALNGISIKTVDKSSGLIQSDKIGLGTNCNLEESGDSSAWALCNRIPEVGTPYFQYPQVMNGELMVLVQEIDGKTQINIHLFNLNAYQSTENGETHYQIRSTHVLEKSIGAYLTDPAAKSLKIKIDPANAVFGEPKAQTDLRAAAVRKQAAQAEKASAIDAKKAEPATIILTLIVFGGILLGALGQNER